MLKNLGDDDIAAEIRHVAAVVGLTVLFGLPLLILLANAGWAQSVSFAYPVALVGTVGATSNTVRRLHRVRSAETLEGTKDVDRRLVVAQIYFSAIVGGVFGVVAYGLFLSGVLQGEFFPQFSCANEEFVSFERFGSCNPATNSDAAMAMIWGFVAGFAERWVPNIIDGMIPGNS